MNPNNTETNSTLLSAPEFETRISEALKTPKSAMPPAKLLLVGFGGLDLLVGDHGTEGARAILREVSVRLGQLVTTGAPGAQLFGDRFAILLRSGVSSKQVTELVLKTLNAPITFLGEEHILQPRFGMAATINASDTRDLIRRATAALQRAESSG
ncbi:MAG: diguanylate cyclase, partial [Planctomycetota bacterium]|nr:diguanylate cyclase [Planctomycetota bacterium]